MLVVARGLKLLLADESQDVLGFIEANVAAKRYEYAVRVKDLGHESLTLARRGGRRHGVAIGLSSKKVRFGFELTKQSPTLTSVAYLLSLAECERKVDVA
jgi:hypothetical protein